MNQNKIDILQYELKQEKAARKLAEKNLESKSMELFAISEELNKTNLKLEELITKNDAELKGVFKSLVDAYILIDIKGNVIKTNDSAIKLFGFNIGNESINIFDLIHPDDYTNAKHSFNELLSKGIFLNYTGGMLTKPNGFKVVHINASVIYNNEQQAIGIQCIVRDITQEKEAQERLIESENRLATLILNLDSGVLLEDENRKIVLTNKKFCQLFSIPIEPNCLIGTDCTNIAETAKHIFKNSSLFYSRINKLVKDKKIVLADELKMVNGKILERDYIPIYKGNEYKGHLWCCRDATLRKKYKKSLEVQKQKYSSIIANMHLGLIETNNEDEILMVNQSFVDMSGYTEAELIGKRGRDLLPIEEDKKIILQKGIQRKKGKSVSLEVRITNKSGEKRFWLASVAPNYNINGEITGSIGVILDITHIKSLEIQKENLLKKVERRNKELQEYVHIVSHDLKSPLRNIDALVNWLKEDNQGKLDDNSLENIALIENTLEKMENLITNILNYSSATSELPHTEKVDLNSLVEELGQLLHLPEHISLQILKKLPVIQGNKIMLQQLFQNLIDNAIRYIDKEKGIIEIDVLEQSTYFQFSIKDNGIGIKKEYHKKIFKIFYSLSPNQKSTGIGLSIVKKIIEMYNGEIWVESQPDFGTTFYFTIKKT